MRVFLRVAIGVTLSAAWLSAAFLGPGSNRAFAAPLAKEEGRILRLTASDAPNLGDSVVISSLVEALDEIKRHNLYYVVRAPSGTVVATHRVELPEMEEGDTYSDSWSISNSSFPETGTYTVVLCWNKGRRGNGCNIDRAETTFYSVPTLGWGLTAVALGLLGVFLWRRREDFRPEGAA